METQNEEITLKELIQKANEWMAYLRPKFKKIALAAVIGALLGVAYSFYNWSHF